MITLEQIKAARVMLGLKQSDLAKKAGVSIATLNNIERGAQTDPKISTMQFIQQALEREGIAFINDTFEGIGVQLRPKSNAPERAVILIVDDNRADRTLYKSWLSKMSGKHYRVYEADNARAGLDAYAEYRPDCIVLDFMMYGTDGFQLLATLKRDHLRLPPIIFVTGMHNDIMEENAQAQGVYRYLNKRNLSSKEFCMAVEQALQRDR